MVRTGQLFLFRGAGRGGGSSAPTLFSATASSGRDCGRWRFCFC